jgi:hypothetical protein
MIEIVVVIFVLIVIGLITYFSMKNRKKEHKIGHTPTDNVEFVKEETISETDPFEQIVSAIETRFFPRRCNTEKEYEKQLISFLGKKFPNRVIRPGHTHQGIEIDFAIDGTYAIELIKVENQGQLAILMDQMVKSQIDFDRTAVVLIDTGMIDTSIIEEYTKSYKKMRINAVIKKV